MQIADEQLTKCAPCTGCWDLNYQGKGIYCRYGGEPATCAGPKEEDTMPEKLYYKLDILPRGNTMINHWEATTVERLLETLKETIIDAVMMGFEVRIRRIKKNVKTTRTIRRTRLEQTKTTGE